MAVASKRRGYMAVASKEAEAIWRLPQKRRKLYGGLPKKEAEAIWRLPQKKARLYGGCPKKEARLYGGCPKKEAGVFRLLLKIGFTPINNSKRKKADIAFGTQD